MRHQLFPTFSPDGIGGHAAAQRQREAGNAVVAAQLRGNTKDTSQDNSRAEQRDYDEGLVHGHFWAMSSTTR